MTVATRAETPADVPGIRAVNLAAFPTSHEADLIESLRTDPAWLPGLSQVAVDAGQVVAYALLSRCRVGDAPSLALGPIAVHPEHQRRGLGQLVTRAALEAARAMGEASVVVLGHPAYYPRFGFTVASSHGIGVALDVPQESLMAMSLDGSALPAGTVRYPEPFGV